MMLFPTELILPTLLSLFIGILFYALLYMLGNLTSRKEVKGLATESFTDLSTVFIYVILAFMFFGLIENVTPRMLGFVNLEKIADPKTGLGVEYTSKINGVAVVLSNINDLPLINVGEAYLLVMYYQGEKLYRSMLLQIGWMNLLSSVSVGGGNDNSITPFKGFDPLLRFAPAMLTSASLMLMLFSAQYFMLHFFVYIIPKFLFPLGILFRVLTPTRSFGSALLALSITMYFIYPLILSYNFAVAINVLGADNLNIDSILYNAPTCTVDEECNSGKCVTIGSNNYCQVCVLAGKIPDNSDGNVVCCSKVSKFDQVSRECILKDETGFMGTLFSDGNSTENINEASKQFGKGGIVTKSSSINNMGLVITYFVIMVLAAFSLFPTLGFATGIFSLFTGGALVVGGLLTTVFGGILLNPLMTFVGLLLYNSKFFFVGFILPAIEFIVLIEFIRVLTGSMGESIDITDIFKVI